MGLWFLTPTLVHTCYKNLPGMLGSQLKTPQAFRFSVFIPNILQATGSCLMWSFVPLTASSLNEVCDGQLKIVMPIEINGLDPD